MYVYFLKSVSHILDTWRASGRRSALNLWHSPSFSSLRTINIPFLHELDCRLRQLPGPRILIDGLWFSRPYGGVTRVWEQILSTLSLDGFSSPLAPVAYLDRDTRLDPRPNLLSIQAPLLDPLNTHHLRTSTNSNGLLAQSWSADVFISSWMSFCTGPKLPIHVALVHDCIPERSNIASHDLLALRMSFFTSASARLCVSRNTLSDLRHFYPSSQSIDAWCHPCPLLPSHPPLQPSTNHHLRRELSRKLPLHPRFILLPGTSTIGSYKNPEVLARALSLPELEQFGLIITGLNSSNYADHLTTSFPSLQGRTIALGLSNSELPELYNLACAVVVPSRVEGFGLPVIEALTYNPFVIIADSPGLQESGGNSALRFPPEDHYALAALLMLVGDSNLRSWLHPVISRRSHNRLSLLHRDFLALELASLSRQAWIKKSI